MRWSSPICRQGLAAFLGVVGAIACNASWAGDLSKIETIVVIYAENRSFEHLYGLFPGANGLAKATRQQKTQREEPMTHRKTALAALCASGLFAFLQNTAQARIVCDGNFQVVNGVPISTPYCREMNLAQVARGYGWRVSNEAIRYSESTKAQLCRAIGYDNRVYEVCSPYRGGSGPRRR